MIQHLNLPLQGVKMVVRNGHLDRLYFEPEDDMKEQFLGKLVEYNPNAALSIEVAQGRGVHTMNALGIEEFMLIDGDTGEITLMCLTGTPSIYEPVEFETDADQEDAM